MDPVEALASRTDKEKAEPHADKNQAHGTAIWALVYLNNYIEANHDPEITREFEAWCQALKQAPERKEKTL